MLTFWIRNKKNRQLKGALFEALKRNDLFQAIIPQAFKPGQTNPEEAAETRKKD
jgi:2-C-methyl-D-erythritol 4-phosphate cytidylyltransferase